MINELTMYKCILMDSFKKSVLRLNWLPTPHSLGASVSPVRHSTICKEVLPVRAGSVPWELLASWRQFGVTSLGSTFV